MTKIDILDNIEITMLIEQVSKHLKRILIKMQNNSGRAMIIVVTVDKIGS